MKWLILSSSIFAVIICTAYDRTILGENTFLKGLVSFELVSILVVILTVTMASVANIHLAIGRLKKNMKDQGVDISELVKDARNELSQNAWFLFGSFCLLLVVLFVKGGVGDDILWLSICHSAAIVIIVLNLLILYDIYRSVYELTSLDEPGVHNGQGDDGSEAKVENQNAK